VVEDLLSTYRKLGWTISAAESCTGGMLSAALTDIPGSSDVFDRGFVTYSNDAKTRMLGVPKNLIRDFGAVSEEVAGAMVTGAREASEASVAIAITGVAGPGGTEAKPEGMVCFGISSPKGVKTETIQFGAIGRKSVRTVSVSHALKMLTNCAKL